MTIGDQETGGPPLPDEVQQPLGLLRERLKRQYYPGQAWPPAAERRRSATWTWAAAIAAVVVLAAGACFVRDAIRPAPQPVAESAAASAVQEPFLVTIPLSSGLDPWMGGGMPNATLAIVVLVDPSRDAQHFNPEESIQFIY